MPFQNRFKISLPKQKQVESYKRPAQGYRVHKSGDAVGVIIFDNSITPQKAYALAKKEAGGAVKYIGGTKSIEFAMEDRMYQIV